MTIPFFQVTAFSQSVFGGNQACVMPLEAWLSDELLLQIAQENAVAETAYLNRLDPGVYALRWFTPDLEMDLCGHATLASAHVVLNHLEPRLDRVEFDTQSGRLVVTRSEHGLDMVLPNRMPTSAELPLALAESLNQTPLEVHLARDFMLVYACQKDVKLFDVLLTGVDQHEVPGEVHLQGRLVQGFGQRKREFGGGGHPVGQDHVESVF